MVFRRIFLEDSYYYYLRWSCVLGYDGVALDCGYGLYDLLCYVILADIYSVCRFFWEKKGENYFLYFIVIVIFFFF